MRITRIEIENYKSFGDRVEVPLRGFNVLIGPNNSGKSNFLDALLFLSDLANGAKAGSLRGGYSSYVFDGDEDRAVGFDVAAEHDGRSFEYSISLEYDSRGRITDETLVVDGELLVERDGTEGAFRHPNAAQEFVEKKAGADRALISDLSSGVDSAILQFRDFVSRIVLYAFELDKLRTKTPISDETTLQPDGENLTSVLHYLRNKHEDRYKELVRTLRSAVPEVEGLETPPEVTPDDKIANLELIEEDLEKRIDITKMSDGTLWLLAHIYVSVAPDPPTVVCYEEAANHVHPRILETITDLLKSAEEQVLVTTHTPLFLDFVDPVDVLVFEKDEGRTRCNPIDDTEEVRELLVTDIPLGDLWYDGQIGGVPE